MRRFLKKIILWILKDKESTFVDLLRLEQTNGVYEFGQLAMLCKSPYKNITIENKVNSLEKQYNNINDFNKKVDRRIRAIVTYIDNKLK